MTSREPAGYFFDDRVPGFSGLVGRDVSRDTLSWGRAAGGIISTTSDLTSGNARCTRAACCRPGSRPS